MYRILLFGCLLVTTGTWAQNQLMNVTRDQFNVSGLSMPANGTVWGMASSEKGGIVGTTYLDTVWAKGNLKLFTPIQPIGGKAVDTLSGLAMRYNLYFNEIEILMNSYKDIRAVQGKNIRSFTLEKNEKPALFVNTGVYETEKQPTGFFEVLVPGSLPLLALSRTVVRKPTYNAAFEVGEKDTKVLMDVDFYVVHGNRAERLSPSRKVILRLMDDRAAEVSNFLKQNEIDFKNRNDLIRVFELYNKRG